MYLCYIDNADYAVLWKQCSDAELCGFMNMAANEVCRVFRNHPLI